MDTMMSWIEAGKTCTAHWRSESGVAPPNRVKVVDDTTKADEAYRLACEGTALLWRGDFQNARQLLLAMSRRADHKPHKQSTVPIEMFNLHRQSQSQRARTLGKLLIPLDAHYTIPLRRAPDVQAACRAVYGNEGIPSVVSLRELLGLIGASEWHKKGVEIPVLGGRIYPHYGVFSPVRGEYIALVNDTPLPSLDLAFDIGTGTGVLAAVLAHRGVKHVIATDQDPRALACARENLAQLGLSAAVDVQQSDLFPAGRAPLIVCNPPWIPARPSSPIEYAIFDPNSQMLRGFLAGLADHLTPNGEGWLILSDIAEHLGLRTREILLSWIAEAGLQVVERIEVRPQHSKAADPTDPLHTARAAEKTSLWRLSAQV